MSLQKQLFKKPLPPSVGDSAPAVLTLPSAREDVEKYLPVDPLDYFDEVEMLPMGPGEEFRVYRSNAEYKGDREPVMFLLLHGAGCSARSWALVAKELKDKGCSSFTFDMRGHGGTVIEAEGADEEWSKETLCRDIGRVVRVGLGETLPQKIVIVGHSMGGALAAFFANGPDRSDGSSSAQQWREVIARLAGIVVIDVVEGTALEALPAMIDIVNNRPASFPSMEMAIRWFTRSKAIHNLRSAKVSVPGMLRPHGDQFTWRSNLVHSEQYWEGWFTGLSKAFLSCRVPKFLVLAGTDRLDTELTVAQMQGKYQLLLLPQAGHYIHEDSPERIANALVMFQDRYVYPNITIPIRRPSHV